jgi:inner membrane protein
MDSITQATLGAAIGEAILGKKIGKNGAILGGIIATIPDLDTVFYLFYDSFDMLSIHRGYSHSILFSLIGASIIAFFLSKTKWTKSVKYGTLWVFAWLALFTHALLDAFTTFGTQLFLPFSDKRIGFDSVNIVDPVYTLPLMAGLVLSLFVYNNKASRSLPNHVGLLISTGYLLLTLAIKQQVNYRFDAALKSQKIDYNSLLTVPVGVANFNWYGVAKTADSLYLHKYSLIDDDKWVFEVFPINEHFLQELDKQQAEKMKWFAKGFFTVDKNGQKIRIYNLQVDMRGTANAGDKRVPTLGYFEFSKNGTGGFDFSSGTIKKR